MDLIFHLSGDTSLWYGAFLLLGLLYLLTLFQCAWLFGESPPSESGSANSARLDAIEKGSIANSPKAQSQTKLYQTSDRPLMQLGTVGTSKSNAPSSKISHKESGRPLQQSSPKGKQAGGKFKRTKVKFTVKSNDAGSDRGLLDHIGKNPLNAKSISLYKKALQ